MADDYPLYATRTRRILLQLIADKLVQRDKHAHQIRYAHAGTDRNLTARTAEVIRAGWVEDVDRTLKVTELGESILSKGKQR